MPINFDTYQSKQTARPSSGVSCAIEGVQGTFSFCAAGRAGLRPIVAKPSDRHWPAVQKLAPANVAGASSVQRRVFRFQQMPLRLILGRIGLRKLEGRHAQAMDHNR